MPTWKVTRKVEGRRSASPTALPAFTFREGSEFVSAEDTTDPALKKVITESGLEAYVPTNALEQVS